MRNMNLKVAILTKCGSQVDLSRRVGIQEDRISRFIHGRAKPTEEEKTIIAEVLGVDVRKIFPEN